MGINVQITLCVDIEIDQAVSSDLVKHVIKEGKASRESRFARAVEVDLDIDRGLTCFA